MELNGGERIAAELVVVGIGVVPRTGLALAADLLVGDGIVVDDRLRTADPDIYALGDCARFPSPHAGRHIRLESVQNATDQARCVAAGICGDPVPYTAVPWFWSEQYALRLQMAGLTSDHDEAVAVGDVAGGRFSVLCFREGRLIGAESLNRPADHGITRRLLAAARTSRPRRSAGRASTSRPSSVLPRPFGATHTPGQDGPSRSEATSSTPRAGPRRPASGRPCPPAHRCRERRTRSPRASRWARTSPPRFRRTRWCTSPSRTRTRPWRRYGSWAGTSAVSRRTARPAAPSWSPTTSAPGSP